MKSLRSLPCVIVLLGGMPACSGSSGGKSSADAASVPDHAVITVAGDTPPAVVAYRDDTSSDWISVPVQGATTLTLTMHGAYQVVVACDFSSQVAQDISIVVHGRTPRDDTAIGGCGGLPPFDVRGVLVQTGKIALGDSGVVTTSAANSPFDLTVEPGMFDLVMASLSADQTPNGIAFRRDMVVDGDADLGSIDLTKEAIQPVVPVSFKVADLHPDEAAGFAARLIAGNTNARLVTLDVTPNELTVGLLPDSALRPTDRQHVTMSAFTETADANSLRYNRSLTRDAVRLGDPTSWVLPDRLSGVMFDLTADRMTATWSTLPEYDDIELLRDGFRRNAQQSVDVRSHDMILSRAFVEATGATSAALDLHAIPGFQSQWQLDPAADEDREFFVTHHVSASEIAGAGVSSSSPDPATIAGTQSASLSEQRMTRFASGGSHRGSKISPHALGRLH